MKIARQKALPIIMNALTEDVGAGDITSAAIFERDRIVSAHIIAKEPCVFFGVDLARWIFGALDEKVVFRPLYKDGGKVKKGKNVIFLKGSIRSILAGERTALNFLGKLSGVATLTNRFVEKVKNTNAQIFGTRKTAPGLRELEIHAIMAGGGFIYRAGLWEKILIKDNHLALLGIKDAVKQVRDRHYKEIAVEVTDLKELKEALDAGADVIMLDNMDLEDIRKAVRMRDSFAKQTKARPALEVSGRVTLESVSKIAGTGIDRISIGSLTHSVSSIDFSLEII